VTDREYKSQKQRVEKILERWVEPCGFGWWRIEHTWHRSIDDVDENVTRIATTRTLWAYRKAFMHWYLPTIQDMDGDELEHTVVHELCHILVAPAWDETATDSHGLEYAVECVAQTLIYGVRNARDRNNPSV
jgi:hypothetical protein